MRLLCFFTLFVLCGCTTFLRYSNPAMQIQQGMSSDAVLKLMGDPQHRSFIDNSEEWVYQHSTVTTTETKVIVVTFVNGKVKGLNSYSQENYPFPQPPIVVNPPIYIDVNRPHYPNKKIVAMDNVAFDLLCNKLNDKRLFRDDKFELFKMGVSNHYFTCWQCARMMSLFTFEDEKLNVLRVVAPRIIDRENFTQIIDSLKFTSDKTTAKKILNLR